jgi:hypothetical protein
VERVLGEHRQDHSEVEGQEPDHRHHEERQPELLAAGGVLQAFLHAPASGRGRSARLAGSDDEQGGLGIAASAAGLALKPGRDLVVDSYGYGPIAVLATIAPLDLIRLRTAEHPSTQEVSR